MEEESGKALNSSPSGGSGCLSDGLPAQSVHVSPAGRFPVPLGFIQED